jgi:hypothetical protein
MAKELREIISQFQVTHPQGARILRSGINALLREKLIPADLKSEKTVEVRSEDLGRTLLDGLGGTFPPYKFSPKPEGPKFEYVREIDALEIRTAARNRLFANGITNLEQVLSAREIELLCLREFGPKSLSDLYKALNLFRSRIEEERQRLGLPDDQPIELQYPLNAIGQ